MSYLVYKVKKYLIGQKLVKKGEKLAAAVSGGPDSVALLFCLNELKEDMRFDLTVFHVNHMLRQEESDRDEKFVKNLANSLNIPGHSCRENVYQYQQKHKCSMQVAAREVRYSHFNKLAARYSISKIATGHTANDQAETVLMRVLKGSGLRGISGIPLTRENKYIRPLLEVHREEIEQFLNQNQIKYITDSTNYKNHYLRNKIKNKLIPALEKEFNPSIIRTLCRSSQIFRSEDNYISEMAQQEFNKLVLKISSKELILDAGRFLSLHNALRRRIILDALYKFLDSKRQVPQNIIENILQVIESNISGKYISVFNKAVFKYQYNQIIFRSQKEISSAGLITQKRLKVPGKTKIDEIGKEVVAALLRKKDIPKDYKNRGAFTAFIDYEFSGKELCIRSRQIGDRFSPLGIEANKKIKDYFIDKKIPREERDSIPLITNKNKILWVVGYQISEFARINKDTRDILMLEVR